MPYYRLYCLDGGGRFTEARDIRASSDSEALSIARDMNISGKCELWERGRMVAKLDARRGR